MRLFYRNSDLLLLLTHRIAQPDTCIVEYPLLFYFTRDDYKFMVSYLTATRRAKEIMFAMWFLWHSFKQMGDFLPLFFFIIYAEVSVRQGALFPLPFIEPCGLNISGDKQQVPLWWCVQETQHRGIWPGLALIEAIRVLLFFFSCRWLKLKLKKPRPPNSHQLGPIW